MKELELDNTILPEGMANLSRSLPKMTNIQVVFCFQHMMRKYVRDPLTFDMEYEAHYLFKGFCDDKIPGGRDAVGEQKHDWHVVRSMAESGYWMAQAREQIIEIAFNYGEQKLTSTEIMDRLSELVEGSVMSATKTTKSKLLNSILRLAGFEDYYGRRSGEAGSKRMWRLVNKEDTFADCIKRFRNIYDSHIDIWS